MSTLTQGTLAASTIHQVSLLCEDIAASRKFYEEVLGAKYLADFNPPGLLFFKFGVTRLLLDMNGSKGLIYLRVEDIDKTVQQLKDNGVEFETDVHGVFKDEEGLFGEAGDTEFMAFFKDPAGNTLALVEQKPG